METLHKSHVTRISLDSSSYNEICINCGATDRTTGGWGCLALPCGKPIGLGGITSEEWDEKEKDRVKRFRE